MVFELYGVAVKTHPQVYEPAEDTFLLLECLREEDLKGKSVLEIGTGTGIVAIFCAKNNANVVATDINEHAVKIAEENAKMNKVSLNLIKGDLFENVPRKKYDLILFNTPYLPEDIEFEDALSKAWDGGKDGRKVINKFIAQVPDYLERNGKVLMVQSSLSGLERTLELFKEKGLNASIKKELKSSFESIQVVEAFF